jgi:hypothetical protein
MTHRHIWPFGVFACFVCRCANHRCPRCLVRARLPRHCYLPGRVNLRRRHQFRLRAAAGRLQSPTRLSRLQSRHIVRLDNHAVASVAECKHVRQRQHVDGDCCDHIRHQRRLHVLQHRRRVDGAGLLEQRSDQGRNHHHLASDARFHDRAVHLSNTGAASGHHGNGRFAVARC